MNKLSIRLGLLFFVFIVLLESMLFFFLYSGIVSERIQTEASNLFARGNSHRDVLEKNFDQETIMHVALMESEAETGVIITDGDYNVITSSCKVTGEMKKLVGKSKVMNFTEYGGLIEDHWKTEKFIATISPIVINGNTEAYVFMFLNTDPIRNMIHDLTNRFLLIGLISIFITLITIFFLSKFLVLPLLEMKMVTEHISQGNNKYKLNTSRNDELGDLARSIQYLSDNLEQMRSDRNEFLSSISHDLRTPLTYLKGYADVATRPNITPEQRNEYLSIIKEEAGNVVELVNDLFELAKMDENQFAIHKERVRLKEFLEKINQNVQPIFHEKNINFQIDCNEQIYANIDTERFKQVITNLLDNALKHSRENTTVEIKITQSKQKALTTIVVSDQGEGIPEADLPYIWDRLYRVDKSRCRSTGGSGLGLAIVKKIIESHGGIITVNSVVNQGTTFTIQLKEGEVN